MGIATPPHSAKELLHHLIGIPIGQESRLLLQSKSKAESVVFDNVTKLVGVVLGITPSTTPLIPRNITLYSLNQAKRNLKWGHVFTEITKDDEVQELITMRALISIAHQDILPHKTIHRSTCLYIVKIKQDGTYKVKCRLVFSGKDQVKGVDYDFKYSYTPSWSSIRILLALTSSQPTITWLIDIRKAYVRTDKVTLDGHRVIIKIPADAWHTNNSSQVFKLMEVAQTLYGQQNSGFLFQ